MTTMHTGPVHVDATEAPVFDSLAFLCRTMLPGEATGGAFSIVEERGRLGCMTPRHIHDCESETFVVLEGALEGWCAGETTLVEAGGLIHLPPRREHAFRVASETARFYTIVTPSGFEAFFERSGVLLTQAFDGELPTPGPVPPEAVEKLQAILTPLGCTITGPPPFAQP
ncbi:MAG: cupin domain-containing protein [Actinomycetota bacterium]|nr:cupin domain-containing protein [Actinomycetota bacterium]